MLFLRFLPLIIWVFFLGIILGFLRFSYFEMRLFKKIRKTDEFIMFTTMHTVITNPKSFRSGGVNE